MKLTLENRPKDVDSPQLIREQLIDMRNVALYDCRFEEAALLSHAIAWLYWLIELEEQIA